MTEIHILSSYDEYIYFRERTASASTGSSSERVAVVLNCEALGRFVQSPHHPKLKSVRTFNIPPYTRSKSLIDRMNLTAERNYFQQAWNNLLCSAGLQSDLDLYLYANFMNAPTAALINYLRSERLNALQVTFLPTLSHVTTCPASSLAIKQWISLLRARLVYGPLLRLVDIGHKTILTISGQAFDEVIFEERAAQAPEQGLLTLTDLSDDSLKIVFACQPLLKNNRVTSWAYREFFKTLCRTLSEINVGIVLKLHPGERKIDYEYLSVPIVSDEIPFQYLDISKVLAVLTFSSGAAAAIEKPVISCSNLLEFCSPADKKEIDRLFDERRKRTGLETASRPTSWEAFIDDIKKAAGFRD